MFSNNIFPPTTSALSNIISKAQATRNKMSEFNWILTEVVRRHGHTISLLEAALIAESMPEVYDHQAYLRSIEDQLVADVCYKEKNSDS